MKPRHIMASVGISIALVLSVPALCLSQNPSMGVVTADAPVFLFPDATRTPLTILVKGTTVRVLQRQGNWYRVVFRDARFGDRTGYISADSLEIQQSAKPPTQAGPRSPERPPSVPSGAARPPAQRKAGTRTARAPFTISINGGLQTTSRGFVSASTFDRFAETGKLNSTYSGDQPVMFDIAMQVGVWRTLSAGIAATQASKPLEGDVTAEIPHPFFFDRPRTVIGTAPNLRRKEIAAHIDASWSTPATRSTRVAIFAGPSYFKVTQGLVTDLTAAEVYPYDTASFESVTTIEAAQSKWGFNVGFDVTQRLSRYFGVGVIGRYSRASFKFPIVAGQDVAIKAGGVQLGGGVRLQF